VLVRDGGDTVVARARGVRKWDVDHGAASNQVRNDDKFNVGSISKPFTGYLMAYLVQSGELAWTTTIGDVFPELQSPSFLTRYGIRPSYVSKTLEQLMTHNADLQYAPLNGGDWGAFRINDSPWLYAEYSTTESELLRRYNYVLTALQDPPVIVPGINVQYSGGSVICGAMGERTTGQAYESLMQSHVYDKLGMTRSGFGRLATPRAGRCCLHHR
jgi:CubicO group peptidase (beta-lactamase class C family)